LGLGLAVELQTEEQLGATAHLLQTSQQVLLPVAAQAEVADPASLATQETAGMAGFMAAQVEVEVQGWIMLETLALAATGPTALSLSPPISNDPAP